MTTTPLHEPVPAAFRPAAEAPGSTSDRERPSTPAPGSRVSILRFALGLLPVPLTLAFQLTFWSAIRPFALFLFVQAVYLSSWIGGLYAGLASTIAAVVVCFYYFVPPERTWRIDEPRHFLVFGLFVVLGVVMSTFHERFRRATRALGESLEEGRRTNDLLVRANDEVSRLYEKTKELDELKTHLFASVSHELRTPLTLVLGPAERLASLPGTDADVRRAADLIARNARTLLHYVEDILEVSKLEARSVAPEYADVDLAELARFVAAQLESAAARRGVAWIVEAPAELRGQVDVARLRRVLLDLLSNALTFTPEGGRVRLTLRDGDAPGRIVFEVADSGPGIPPDEREAVFNAYFHLGKQRLRRSAGTGLGLSIARELVAVHGGSIRIADAPEGGALFLVDLPRVAPPGTAVGPVPGEAASAEAVAEAREYAEEIQPTAPAAAVPAGREDRALVLVVEDNPDMNTAIRMALCGDYRVATAFDGKQGLDKALELAPDLVLTDVMMPEMSGEELLRAIRARPELDGTPVVVLTAVADEEVRVRLLREGARDYVTKPFAVEELLARVDSAVAQRRAEREIRSLGAQLEAVSRASMTISEAVAKLPKESVEAVLRTIAAEAQALTGAEYVAVGLGSDPNAPFEPWVFVGMSPEQEAALGRHPRPVGVLGLVALGGGPLRLPEVRAHPAHVGFPPGHPEMKSFLGVPVRYRDRAVGHIYLTNKRGGAEFTEADQRTVEMLAARAGVAVQTAQLYEAERRARAWLEAVIAQLPDPVILRDARGSIAMLNRAAQELRRAGDGRRDPFGEEPPLELHLPGGGLLAPEDAPSVRALALGEPTFGRELRIRRGDGSMLPVSASAVAINGPGGDRIGAVTVFRDLSAQKDIERMREEWSAVVAHDLRQPVAAIELSVGLARRAHPGVLGEAEAKHLARIESASRRLRGMIEELLDATRLEARRLAITPTETDVAAAVREVSDRMANVTTGHPVAVHESGGPCVAWADSGRIEQVVGNLLSNAAKYGEPGSEIGVDVEARDDEVEVRVTNRGRGIPADEVPHLFQRFMRSKASLATGVAGIGLGLYICKGLIEAHGGRIWVESTPGETTTFHFTLTRRPATAR